MFGQPYASAANRTNICKILDNCVSEKKKILLLRPKANLGRLTGDKLGAVPDKCAVIGPDLMRTLPKEFKPMTGCPLPLKLTADFFRDPCVSKGH